MLSEFEAREMREYFRTQDIVKRAAANKETKAALAENMIR